MRTTTSDLLKWLIGSRSGPRGSIQPFPNGWRASRRQISTSRCSCQYCIPSSRTMTSGWNCATATSPLSRRLRATITGVPGRDFARWRGSSPDHSGLSTRTARRSETIITGSTDSFVRPWPRERMTTRRPASRSARTSQSVVGVLPVPPETRLPIEMTQIGRMCCCRIPRRYGKR